MLGIMKKRPILLVVLILLLLFIVLSVLFIYHRYSPGKEWADYAKVYDVDDGKAAVFYNNEWLDADGFILDSKVYIDIETVTGYFNAGFYFSDESEVLYVLPTSLVKAEEGEKRYEINGMITETDYQVFKIMEDKVYLCLDFIMEFTDIYGRVYTEPDRVMVFDVNRKYTSAVIKKNSYVRRYAGIKSLILYEALKGETVEVIDSVDNWLLIRTDSGYIGYVRAGAVSDKKDVEESGKTAEYEYESLTKDYQECIGWHQVFTQEANESLDEYLEGSKGLTVISPTWFSITDENGSFSSIASAEYVERAHELGLEVWALIDDFDADLDRRALFYNSSARRNLIDGLISAAEEYKFDGINIDFEKIDSEAASHFLQFIRELSMECRKNGIVLSVDNYVVSGGRSWYNISEQSRVVDYAIIMGYDEHWKGSEPGSNASLSFTEKGVADALEMVPSDKLIYALPFFMRVWTEIPEEMADEDAVIFNDENSHFGRYAVTSEAIGMAAAQSLIQENGASVEWNAGLGQYYGEYEKDGCLNRIWIEDSESLKTKLDVINNYETAGLAFWKLGLETEDVWDVIISYLKSKD